MGAALGTYAVVYRQLTEVLSPPKAWDLDLSEFQFGTIYDFDLECVRGAGFLSKKTTTSCIIDSVQTSRDGILEVRIIVRRALPLWDDIS